MNYLHGMGVPIPMCAKLMSHKSTATSKLYLRQFAADLIGNLESLRTSTHPELAGVSQRYASVQASR